MRTKIVTSAVLGLVLVTGACGKKKLAELPPAGATSGEAGVSGAAGADGTSGLDGSGSVAGAALPGSRADMIARAGSDTIYFNTDASILDDAGRATLDAQAAWLAANPTVRVSIEGHADERGTREYNLALGDRRANAARNQLASKGVAADRMTVVSWGKERPVASGSDEASWAQNRRAVTVTPN